MVNCDPGASHFIAHYFGDCVYNSKELWGFTLGLSSIACWSVSQLPQLIKNYKIQSSDALSPWFIAEWLVGDTLNLIGCLLRGDQLATQIWTSEYFILMDSVMLLQYLYYTTLQRRRERSYALAATYKPPGPHHHHRKRRRRGPPHHQEEEVRSGEPEISTENVIYSNINDNNNDEILSIEAAAGNINHINSSTFTNTGTFRTGKSILASGGGSSALMMGLILTTLMIGLATRQGNIDTMILSPSSDEDEASQMSSQLLLDTTTTTQNHHHYDLSQLGTTFGYLSSAFYLGARVSQLYKNFKRQSAVGLALSMFLCAILANFLYGLSILLRAEDFGDVIISAPWLLGSLGTMLFDVAILMQSLHYYRRGGDGGEKERRSDEEEPLLSDGGGGGAYDRHHHRHHHHHHHHHHSNNGDESIDVS